MFAAAAGGAAFPPDDWYAALNKPAWNPPGWVFGPVWTTLYVMIATAGWLLWRRLGARSAAFAAWLIQVALNAAWTPLFFGLHKPAWALVDIVLLLAAIATTMALAWRAERWASWLLLPYLAWVAFATCLNAAIWRLNA